jgi:hypothetical protein
MAANPSEVITIINCKCEVIPLRVITLKVIALSDHRLKKILKFRKRKILRKAELDLKF